MATILSILLVIIFAFLGSIHFYWLFGGKRGLSKVFPTKENEESNLSIPPVATLLVALLLMFFGFLYFVKSGHLIVNLASWLNYFYWFIPAIFIIRAIGEFKYVGFFKKVKNTEFAEADTKWFSPLCLLIGGVGFFLLF